MIEDDFMRPSPVRVLCQDGQFTPDAPEDLIAKYGAPAPIVTHAEPRVPPPVELPPAGKWWAPKRSVGRPRTKPAPDPAAARGRDWKRMDHVTAERILELQARGLTIEQIGLELGCTRYTIHARLHNARVIAEHASKVDAALRTCACGRPKWAARKRCARCNSRAK